MRWSAEESIGGRLFYRSVTVSTVPRTFDQRGLPPSSATKTLANNVEKSLRSISLLLETGGARKRELVTCSDEIVADAFISDPTCKRLSDRDDSQQRMDLVFTVGQSYLFSMVCNTLGVQLEDASRLAPPPPAVLLALGLAALRSRGSAFRY